MKIKIDHNYIVIESIDVLDKYSRNSWDTYAKIVPKLTIINKNRATGFRFCRNHMDINLYVMEISTDYYKEEVYTRSYDEYIEARVTILQYIMDKIEKSKDYPIFNKEEI